jgi:hypothetical protein
MEVELSPVNQEHREFTRHEGGYFQPPVPARETKWGPTDPEPAKIVLNYNFPNLKSAFIHEIQHAIQDIEGFAPGSHPGDKNYRHTAGEVEARNAEARMGFTAQQRLETLLKETETLHSPESAFNTNKDIKKKESNSKNLLNVLPLKKHISLNHGSGDFEKNFKALVREQGTGADSLLTAKFLVYSMPPGDKAELNKNFLSNGVKNTGDLERLLAKWKSEALLANHKPEHTLRQKQTVSAGYER